MSDSINELRPYLPENTVENIHTLIQGKNLLLKITKHRKSKFGDYRPPQQQIKHHTITVNGTLNPYAFLITFLHEFAHLQIFELYKGRVSPHGKEWKTAFALLLHEELLKGSFPLDLAPAVKKYLQNPKASTFSDPHLYESLRAYDTNNENRIPLLKTLNSNSVFRIGKKQFRKGELRRTRYVCKELNTGKLYLVHKNAEVIPLELP